MECENSGLEVKQMFITNMQLLGFNSPVMEAEHLIPFNKSMFELPNKRGAEIVLHYLFQRLNPTMCKEAFRDSWPILDKKREQLFRKTCSNWLTNILQDEPDSHLPRINASLFMSPGGEKFYQLLFFFSGYVLRKVVETELGVKPNEMLKCPSLTTQNQNLADVRLKSLTCSSVSQRKQFFSTVQMNVQANKRWKDTADEYVKEYRKLNKQVRELDYKIRDEEQKSVQASLARGSPVKKRGSVEHFDPEFDPKTIKRSQRIQQVRDMWKQLKDFDHNEQAEREVVESIVERTINKHRLDAADISVKVPDMLLRECQDEIRRRNVDNTYNGGKLNIVSVLQLWNLSLHLYLEKLHQVGVPKFDEEVQKLTSQVHVQQNYTQKAQHLRHQMSERIPILKTSIEELRARLDKMYFEEQTPESIRMTSLGLGLVQPTPKPSFSPGLAVTPAEGVGVIRSLQDVLDTPEASSQITEQMRTKARKQLDHQFKEPNLNNKNVSVPSSIPRPRSEASSRHSSRPTSARSTTSSKGGKSSVKSTPKTSRSDTRQQKPSHKPSELRNFPKVSSPRTAVENVSYGDSFFKRDVHDDDLMDADLVNNRSGFGDINNRSGHSDSSQPLSARSAKSEKSSGSDKTLTERSFSKLSPRSRLDVKGHFTGRKSPSDLLVDEIMGDGKILSPFNSGLEAFESQEVVRRTPDLVESNNNATSPPDEDLPATPPNSEKGDAEPEVTATPPNSEKGDGEVEVTATPPNSGVQSGERSDDDNDHIVNVLGPELKDGTSENVTNSFSENRSVSFEDILARAGRLLGGQIGVETQSYSDGNKNEELEKDASERMEKSFELDDLIAGNNRQFEKELGKEVPDNVIDEMIQEGIRQATEDDDDDDDDDDDLDDVEVVTSYKSDINRPVENLIDIEQVDDDYGDDGDFEEIKGPNLESDDDDADDDDDVGSIRSTGELIVIDRSIHMSPRQPKRSSPQEELISSLDSPEMLIDEERFPPIIIDRSFQYTPVYRTVQPSSPAREMLSRSLLSENRSPLSDEIRKMFQKAVADTPARGTHPQGTQEHVPPAPLRSDSDLELPNMDLRSRCRNQEENGQGLRLQKGDISWDLTENIDDIELPDVSLEKDDLEKDDLELISRKVKAIEEDCFGSAKQLDDEFNGEIDDFFASKTPELPKRRAQNVIEKSLPLDTEQDQGDLGSRSLNESGSRSLNESGSNWPAFPREPKIEDEAPLISLSP